ncbi:hypothetical protein QUC31_001799 [Theobroma cacao]
MKRSRTHLNFIDMDLAPPVSSERLIAGMLVNKEGKPATLSWTYKKHRTHVPLVLRPWGQRRRRRSGNVEQISDDEDIPVDERRLRAITSCTNASNPSVMLGAGLVAKKACELVLEVKPWVKTSFAPDSGVVTKYLLQGGLQKDLNQQAYNIVGFGSTTCIGNSGGIDELAAPAISENDIVAAAVHSGNHTFESRVHPLTRDNYLASPPLVVAYALAGTDDIDFEKEPIGTGKDGKSVYFRDIWPSNEEIAEVKYDMLGETISENGQILFLTLDSPAAKYLLQRGVDRRDFNSYGSRRGNDEVMARGAFANIRIVNKILKGEFGPKTIHIPTGDELNRYMAAGQGTTIIAAKGSTLLGVKAAIAKSFERIHRSNPVGMRIIPHCFKPGEDACFLGLTGHERYTIDLPSKIREIRPGQHVTITTDTGKSFTCTAQRWNWSTLTMEAFFHMSFVT